MAVNVPSPEDFFSTGKELLDFSWDVVAHLLKNLHEAEQYGVDPADVSEAYWLSASRRLTTALAVTQQGVEFVIKGKIAAISPFLLLADPPSRWPSPSDSPIDFSSFRTIDAQDLVKVHDTFAPERLEPSLVQRFNDLRDKRNRIMHSVDKNLTVHVVDVVDSLLFVHMALFPGEAWASVRLSFLETAPESQLDGADYVVNTAAWELELVLSLLSPAQVKAYLGIDKKQRRYTCPECYWRANTDNGFDHKLAVLMPKGPESQSLYCLLCNSSHPVARDDCSECEGNVLSEEGMCLSCCGR